MAWGLEARERIEAQFVVVARELATLFPEVDLRFNLASDTNFLRFRAPEFTEEVFEFRLGETDTNQLIYEAIFTIKQAARLFDA